MGGMVADRIEREVYVQAPVDRVWRVLTTPEHIRVWYAFEGCEVDPRPGGTLRFRWDEQGEFHGRVEKSVPDALFRFRLASEPDRALGAEPGDSTLVEFALSAEGPGTRLRLTESGIQELAVPDAAKAKHAEYAAATWATALEELSALAAASHN
ncbi:SRPBCC domain-containing protein [Streptomyces sp. NBS 14/10]|uniref:SRPBCC domain-containing protein n=1 Tax=Streptomyces sp. NBS 14/10 TaxID=1945643 RepID=UPI00211B164F|nr:SRPBCC domain-containing protein [Streptomyces sp. NBS 14/10]KAK1178547.1 SRPBCC domain-containing protein [Streptomyces sp. NBS 14/10]